MNRLLVFSAILALSIIAATPVWSQTPAASHAAIEKQIVTMERAINDAIAKGDMKAFHASLAPDAVGVDGGGVTKVNSPDFDKMMQTAKIQSWNLDNSQFYWVDDNTVVHMYRWTDKGTFNGQPVPSPVWSSTIWTNKGGKWVAVVHQETEAMAAATPAKK